MSNDRVGRDIPAATRWKERGERYAQGIDGPYHRHRLEVIRALLPDLAGAQVIDVGCGEGVLIRGARMRRASPASISITACSRVPETREPTI